jgi:hypothetical protein
MEIKKLEIRISGEASIKDQLKIKKLDPKLETLNSKQTQNLKPKTKLFRVLSLFRILGLGFRV